MAYVHFAQILYSAIGTSGPSGPKIKPARPNMREVEATSVSFAMATRDPCTRFAEITRARSEKPDRRARVVADFALSSGHDDVPGQDWA